MKKILLSVAGLFLIGLCANAQPWGFGPKVGASFSTVNGVEGAKMRAGVVAGVFADRMINDWLSVEADLLYAMNGFRVHGDNGVKSKINLDYIYMPVVAKFYLTDGLNFQLGARFGYLVTSKEDVDGGDKYTIRDAINRYDVDLLAGLAYDFDFGMIIEGRYNIGATKMLRVASANPMTNGALEFSVGWRF
ncbi:porin family protein [Gallalistipes aquisgranensis]|uniref:porin family protein n=1 Tax=Gallalistipes aquisgranensis TaxID=2779358 RepID=UPI001CF7F017|nr:porin family protein [Gallalistipes aquisgranensis]MBE5032726.1 PorT family protein [Gallalistipes aquisgranensis]